MYVHVVHDHHYEIRATADSIDKPVYQLIVDNSKLNIKAATNASKVTVIMLQEVEREYFWVHF